MCNPISQGRVQRPLYINPYQHTNELNNLYHTQEYPQAHRLISWCVAINANIFWMLLTVLRQGCQHRSLPAKISAFETLARPRKCCRTLLKIGLAYSEMVLHVASFSGCFLWFRQFWRVDVFQALKSHYHDHDGFCNNKWTTGTFGRSLFQVGFPNFEHPITAIWAFFHWRIPKYQQNLDLGCFLFLTKRKLDGLIVHVYSCCYFLGLFAVSWSSKCLATMSCDSKWATFQL